ncbi:MAG: hypothetical protein U0703_22625 [Anaerolineae bacterium]
MILRQLEERGHIYKAALPESATAEEREEAGDKGEATWFRSTAFGDSKDRVMVKSSGEPTYTLPDIAYRQQAGAWLRPRRQRPGGGSRRAVQGRAVRLERARLRSVESPRDHQPTGADDARRQGSPHEHAAGRV